MMQEEQNVNIEIDTSVLKEREYANVAWVDHYNIEILTADSQRSIELIQERKEKERTQLKNGILLQDVQGQQDIDELILQRMAEMPLFTTKADYYALNIKAEPKNLSLGFYIGFFTILGMIGYILAKYRTKRKRRL